MHYPKHTGVISGLKDGILLEAGYDTTTPNIPCAISSWAYDKAITTAGIDIKDNRAIGVPCYDPRYTLVEKLQTICTKFRREQVTGQLSANYMRQYYDVYCLLSNQHVKEFLNTDQYRIHKQKRFPEEDLKIPLAKNEAFLLSNESVRASLQSRYERTRNLYYRGQPSFEEILSRINQYTSLF
nr:nucleotidyl transferase AbiEii/AbiGii toxin family protein [Terrimonas ferruginea]